MTAPDQRPRPPDPECLACRDMRQQLQRTGRVELRVVRGRLVARRDHATGCMWGGDSRHHTERLLQRLLDWSKSENERK